MAKTSKNVAPLNPELAGVDIDRKTLLAKVGTVSVKDAAKQAAMLGDVPTDSGRQRMLALYFFALGQADKGPEPTVDCKAVFMANANTYYGRGGLNDRPWPKQGSLDRAIEAYGKFFAVGRLPYNSYPIVQHCLAMRNVDISRRGTAVLSMRNAHPKKPPTAEEITAAFTPKAPEDKAIDTYLKALCSGFEARVKDEPFMALLKSTGGDRLTTFQLIAGNIDTLRRTIEPDNAKNVAARAELRGKVAALAANVVAMKPARKKAA